MIDLQDVGTDAIKNYTADAVIEAWEKLIKKHLPPCDDDMEVPAVEEYTQYLKATMTAWAALAHRGCYGEGIGAELDCEIAKYTADSVVWFWVSSICRLFRYPIEWETVFLIAVYDESVNYNLRFAMQKLNRLEIAGELDGHTVLETVAALNRKYHGSVEKGIYPYTL